MERPTEIPQAGELTGTRFIDELEVILLLHIARYLREGAELGHEMRTRLADHIEAALHEELSHAQIKNAIVELGGHDARGKP